jgi:hypothetical protein
MSLLIDLRNDLNKLSKDELIKEVKKLSCHNESLLDELNGLIIHLSKGKETYESIS